MILYPNIFDLFTFCGIARFFLCFASHSQKRKREISVMTMSLIIIYYDAWLEEYKIERNDFNADDGNILTKIRYWSEKKRRNKIGCAIVKKELFDANSPQQNDHHLTEFQLSWHYMQFNLKHISVLTFPLCNVHTKYVSEVEIKREMLGQQVHFDQSEFAVVFHGFISHLLFMI